MKLIINGKKLELTEAIKAYVQEKVGRLELHFDFIRDVQVHLSVEKGKHHASTQVAEATIQVNGGVLRYEVSSEDLYASIDLLVDKIERGLRRYKSKQLLRSKAGRSAGGESIRHGASLLVGAKAATLEAGDAFDDDGDDEDNFYPWSDSEFDSEADPLAAELDKLEALK